MVFYKSRNVSCINAGVFIKSHLPLNPPSKGELRRTAHALSASVLKVPLRKGDLGGGSAWQ